MIIDFDRGLSSAQYLARARRHPGLTRSLAWMTDPQFGFGINRRNMEFLLARPDLGRGRVVAEFTTRSNVRVRWEEPTENLDTVDHSELFWFRGYRTALSEAKAGNDAGVLLIYAHMARYNEAVALIRTRHPNVECSELIYFWEFQVGIR